MKSIILVALGGGLGSSLRYLIGKYIPYTIFPFSTWIINIIGSLCIGFLFAYTLKNPDYKLLSLFLMTGVCGGFTTFSTFSLETFKLMQNQQYMLAFAYICSSVLLGLGATFVGFWMGK